MSALLLLLPVVRAATVTLPESPPEGFTLDGDLSEWSRAPDLNLGPGEQLSGDPGEASDFSAAVWWSADMGGLVLAIDVTDQTVLFAPRGTDPMLGDHVSLWIALPSAELPPIGVVTEEGEVVLRTPADCEAQHVFPDVASCKAWVIAQPSRRARLNQLFIRQYELTLGAVMESWSGSCAARPIDPPDLSLATCRGSQVALKRTDHGYALEARIGLTDFPATRGDPMTHVRLLVDAVDNDLGHDGQEATYASDRAADPNRPDTLPRYDLLRPPLFDSDPPLFAATQQLDTIRGLFYYPSLRLTTAYVFENVLAPSGSADVPQSPQITPLDWSKPRRLGGLHDLSVYEAPGDGAPCTGCDPGRRLVMVRGDAAFDAEDLGQGVVRVVASRGETLHLIVGERTPADPKAPQGPAIHVLRVLEVTEDGAVDEIFRQTLDTGAEVDGYVYASASEQIVPDGSGFGFVGKRAHAGSAEKPQDFKLLSAWNPETETYEPVPSAN